MPHEELRPLKQVLLDEYGHFADRRCKKIDSSDLFIIDDREVNPSFGASGEPFGWFCQMAAQVKSSDSILLSIRGPIPENENVLAWLKRNQMNSVHGVISLLITPSNVDELNSLAASLLSIVDKGVRYNTPSHKYVCPRIAVCLKRLHGALTGHWKVSAANSN